MFSNYQDEPQSGNKDKSLVTLIYSEFQPGVPVIIAIFLQRTALFHVTLMG